MGISLSPPSFNQPQFYPRQTSEDTLIGLLQCLIYTALKGKFSSGMEDFYYRTIFIQLLQAGISMH